MTYLRRAIKYFFYYCILLSVILTALVLLNMVEADVQAMFRGGWSSVGQVLGLFAVVAAIYPRFGFTAREALVSAPDTATLVETMQNRGYNLEKEADAICTFRLRNVVNRLSRMAEDRITVSRTEGGYSLEGPTKDVVRLIHALEYAFKTDTE